jgi:O-antigen/teichoic acid export membrane protein
VLPTRDRSPAPSLALNASSVVIGEAASRVAATLAFILLSRVFPPEVYGLLAFAASLTALAMPIVDFGLVTVAGAAVARDHDAAGEILGRVWRLRLALAMAGIVVIVAVSAMTGPRELTVLSVVYAAGLIPTAFGATWLAQTLGRPALFALEKTIQSFTLLALVVLVISAEAVPWMVATAVLLSTLMAVAVATPLTLRLTGVTPAWRPGGERELALQALPVFFAILPIGLLLPAVGLAVGWLQGIEDLGNFWVAARLLVAGGLIGNAVWSTAFPLLSAGHRDRAWQIETVADLTWRTLAIGIAGAWLTIAGAPVLTQWVFGPLYDGAAPLVRWTGPIVATEAAGLVLIRLMPVFGNTQGLPRAMALAFAFGAAVFGLLWNIIGVEAFMAAILAVHATVLLAAVSRWPSAERRRLASPPGWFVAALASGLGLESILRMLSVAPDPSVVVRAVVVGAFVSALVWTRLRRPLIPAEGDAS